MASADFSQFVVTTANGTVCETSPIKVRALSPYLPATSTGTSGNFWTSSFLADLSVFPSLICGSCSSGQGFAYSFLQIQPHDGHPCCSAMCFVVAYAHSGLSPVRARPWRANQKRRSRRAGPSFNLVIQNYLVLMSLLIVQSRLYERLPVPDTALPFASLTSTDTVTEHFEMKYALVFVEAALLS